MRSIDMKVAVRVALIYGIRGLLLKQGREAQGPAAEQGNQEGVTG